MRQLRFCFLVLACCGLLGSKSSPSASAHEIFSFDHENVLGTSLHIRCRASTLSHAERAQAAVLAELDRLANVFSTYNRESEFSRWQRLPLTDSTPVSPELWNQLSAADRWPTLT